MSRPRANANIYVPRARSGAVHLLSVCLVSLKREFYLAPEASRATFPVKTLDECRIECIRSMQVLRFPCNVMGYRRTSQSGGSCQLSDMDHRQISERDYIAARDRFEHAVTFFYDDRDPICRRPEEGRYNTGGVYGHQSGGYYDRDRYGSGYGGHGSGYYGGSTNSHYGSQGRNPYPYPTNDRNSHYDRYPYGQSRYSDYNSQFTPSSGSYYNGRYSSSYADRRYDGDYNRYGYKGYNDGNRYPSYDRYPGGSGSYGHSHDSHHGQSWASEGYTAGAGLRTVNGERCLNSCRRNRDAGFYYCQVDNQGSWDFCCRPDHYCGYSTGLSVPWCYVGTGPSQNIWRSCNQRALTVGGASNSPYDNQRPYHNPNVAYLHERPPPTIHKLTNNEIANLTRDSALKLFNGTAPNFNEDNNNRRLPPSSTSLIQPFSGSSSTNGNVIAKQRNKMTAHIIKLDNIPAASESTNSISGSNEAHLSGETKTSMEEKEKKGNKIEKVTLIGASKDEMSSRSSGGTKIDNKDEGSNTKKSRRTPRDEEIAQLLNEMRNRSDIKVFKLRQERDSRQL